MGGLGKDETISVKRAAAPTVDYAKMAEQATRGVPPSAPPTPRVPQGDTRKLWQRGLDRLFFDPRPEPYVIQWNPIADGIAAHQQEQHDL